MRVIHIIDTLNMGGAEILLKNVVNALQDWQHVVVFLTPPNSLANEFKGEVCFICLHHGGWKHSWRTIQRIKTVIKDFKPDLVHSNLLIASIFARLATPANLPLINTLHSIYSLDAFRKGKKSLWCEKLTLKKRHILIAVSNFVLQDYLAYVPFKGRCFVLYNFLPDEHLQKKATPQTRDVLRCVAVGNLKEAKNYMYLLEVFAHLPNCTVHLDIYGEGPLRGIMEQKINEQSLPVVLKGQHNDPVNIFKNYDLFLQASSHEGFGLSVIEAMATGLPTFLSDIPVFREITGGYAHFFPLQNAAEAARLLEQLQANEKLCEFVSAGYDWCKRQYNAAAYKEQLVGIYKKALTGE